MTRATILTAAALWTAPLAAAGEPKLCSRTAQRLLRACESANRDDAWIAAANCANVGNAAERGRCEQRIARATREQRKDCAEQRRARESLCDAIGQAAYDPPIDPARFVEPPAAAAKPNRFFPLVPGRTWTYRGGAETVSVTVTGDVRTILGVRCAVVRDVVTVGGVAVEDTEDYFAQDRDGNVWYFGELSKSFDGGYLTDLEGSWIAGVNDAKPGLVMAAAPEVGRTYRQEFAAGNAEDAAEVASVTASASVPGAACNGTCVQTRDFTPVEPGHEEQKFYAPGIGLILEVNPETGERTELIESK